MYKFYIQLEVGTTGDEQSGTSPVKKTKCLFVPHLGVVLLCSNMEGRQAHLAASIIFQQHSHYLNIFRSYKNPWDLKIYTLAKNPRL